MNPITVLLADDHEIVRQGLRKLLEAERDIRVVGEAATGRLAVTLARRLHPAVVVMDIAMPLLNGLEAARQIRHRLPDTRVVILSAHSDAAYVDHATASGASGFLLKQTSSHALATAIREAVAGRTLFSPAIDQQLKSHFEASPDRKVLVRKKAHCLSSREIEVLQLIAEGQPNKRVASELGISVKTVEKHRQRLMEKLNIHDTAGLTRYAIAAGIIESSVQLTILP
jgi:DNA-binding NarL/FixJ family response regulator